MYMKDPLSQRKKNVHYHVHRNGWLNKLRFIHVISDDDIIRTDIALKNKRKTLTL